MKPTPKTLRASCRTAVRWTLSLVIWAVWRIDQGHAQDQTVSGNLAVTGTADVEGDSLLLGAPAGLSGQPGLTLHYGDGSSGGVPDQIQFAATRPQTSWLWLYAASGGALQPQMWLDSTNVLTIYDRTAAPNGAIQLNPSGASLFTQSLLVNGTDSRMPNQTLADPSSLLTEGLADARYLSLAAAADYLTTAASDARYVRSGASGIALGTASTYWYTLPTVALPGGTATGAGSFAAINSTASGSYSSASGYRSSSTGFATCATGYGSSASGYFTTASGTFSKAIDYYSVAIGVFSVAKGSRAIAIGYQSVAGADDSIALGNGSTTEGEGGSIASGYRSNARGYRSNAAGAFSSASAQYSTALGLQSTASGYRASALGVGAFATGTDAVATGAWATASGFASVATGDDSVASGEASVASGFTSTASGRLAVAAGPYTIASGAVQFVIGQYNVQQGDPFGWYDTDDLFQIGNGTGATSRSNAFTVTKGGDATIGGNANVHGTLTADKINVNHIDPKGDLSMGSFTEGQ